MELTKLNELLKIRELLQKISNKSYNFSILNKQYPINLIDSEEMADEVMNSYNKIIEEIAEDINKFSSNNL